MSEQRIIYPNETGGVVLVAPAPNCGLTVEEIAAKDVPAGVPYLIVNLSDLPSDFDFFDAWTADFSAPDGAGVGAKEWFRAKGML
jgi:hypothetical protein